MCGCVHRCRRKLGAHLQLPAISCLDPLAADVVLGPQQLAVLNLRRQVWRGAAGRRGRQSCLHEAVGGGGGRGREGATPTTVTVAIPDGRGCFSMYFREFGSQFAARWRGPNRTRLSGRTKAAKCGESRDSETAASTGVLTLAADRSRRRVPPNSPDMATKLGRLQDPIVPWSGGAA